MKTNRNYMIKIITALVFLFILISLWLFFYEPPYNGDIQSDETLLIAHRGFGNYAPDNTLSAIKSAIDYGLGGVDLDSQLTKDEELIIFHDPKLDRLTNGTGVIRDKTLEELKRIDAGYGFHKNFTNYKILTLDEMIKEVNGEILMIVELKSAKIKSEGIEEKAVKAIQENNAYNNVYLSSFNPFVIYRIEKIDNKVNTVFIFRDIVPNDPTQFAKIPFFLKKESFRKAIRKIIKPDFLSIEITVKDDTIIQLQNKGYPIFLWPPNTKKEIQLSLDRKPFGLITDEPISALNISGEKNG